MLSPIDHAIHLLKAEDVVAIPTETVYGLAARIDSDKAIKKIFAVKERPFFDPLIVHVHSIEQARICVSEWNEVSDLLARHFWPGPLTLVLPKSDLISDVITSGLPSVGLRWPKHETAQELLQKINIPLAAPSANKFGRTSPTKAEHVKDEFGNSIFILESPAGDVGIESTVLSVKKINHEFHLAVLRKGAVLQSEINTVLVSAKFNFKWSAVIDKKESPGHMKHHYMPSVPLVICRNDKMKLSELSKILNEKLNQLPDEVEGVKIVKPTGAINKIEFLKLSDQPQQAARELYAQLRSVSQRKPDAICFIQSSKHHEEMWESVFDRLYKAASLILD